MSKFNSDLMVMTPKDYGRLQRSGVKVQARLEALVSRMDQRRQITLKRMQEERMKYLEENHLIMFI